jgi:hypothetical protein
MGLSTHLICQVLMEERPDFDGSGFHVFDSFEGLPEPTPEDAIPDDHPDAVRLRSMSVKGRFAAPLDLVRSSLSRFPRVSYHVGWIPETFDGLPDASYRFVHLDVDLYQPTYDALDYFCGRLAPGGMIVCDDYSWPGARLAVDAYAKQHGLSLDLPATGQAAIRLPL